jgi:hypothetical protein
MKLALSALYALVLCASASAAAGDLRFAHRFPLELAGNAPYYTVVLPQSVYAASQRGDLGDLRVLNGASEPVPYTFDVAVSPTQTVRARRVLAWFPLPAASADSSNVPLGVTVAPDGSLHAAVVRSSQPAAARDVLIDLGQSGLRADALWVHLRNADYQGRVSVEQSEDLRTWQQVGDAQLLRLTYGGKLLVQERIGVEGPVDRYLRLRWLDDAPGIESIELETAAQVPGASAGAEVQQWRAAAGVRMGETAGEYLFETDGPYPVDGLMIGLPQRNTVVNATIESRPDAQQPWQRVTSSTLFRLAGKSGEQGSGALAFADNTDQFWRIVVDTRGGGLGSGTPVVQVGWHAAQVTFVARGNAPFTLGVGNAAMLPAAVARDALIVGETATIMNARVGERLAEPTNAGFVARVGGFGCRAALCIVGCAGNCRWGVGRDGGPACARRDRARRRG